MLGALVGAAEILSRYRSSPVRALTLVPARWYVGINAAGSLAAFGLARLFGWTFGANGDETQIVATQALTAGFGSMALFRTSLFTVRAGNQDIGIGPSAVLTVLLGVADREVDRREAESRSRAADMMEGISFVRAMEALPTYCLALMQNLSETEQKELARSIAELERQSIPDEVKARILGVYLMKLVGDDVLRAAVDDLRKQIAVQPPPAPSTAATPASATPAPSAPDRDRG